MDGLTRDYLEWCLKHPLEAAFRAVRWMNVDAEVLSRLLEEAGFRVSYSEGWMLPVMNGLRYPYFRRGVIRAVNG